jgi:hypothetical protein
MYSHQETFYVADQYQKERARKMDLFYPPKLSPGPYFPVDQAAWGTIQAKRDDTSSKGTGFFAELKKQYGAPEPPALQPEPEPLPRLSWPQHIENVQKLQQQSGQAALDIFAQYSSPQASGSPQKVGLVSRHMAFNSRSNLYDEPSQYLDWPYDQFTDASAQEHIASCKGGQNDFVIADGDGGPGVGEIETLMIKNIPCRCTHQEVLDAIDSLGFGDLYNFFHLPIRRGHGQNFGYAFLGFADKETTKMFADAVTGFRFANRNSSKACAVAPARIQGFICNVDHFQKLRSVRRKNQSMQSMLSMSL